MTQVQQRSHIFPVPFRQRRRLLPRLCTPGPGRALSVEGYQGPPGARYVVDFKAVRTLQGCSGQYSGGLTVRKGTNLIKALSVWGLTVCVEDSADTAHVQHAILPFLLGDAGRVTCNYCMSSRVFESRTGI